MIDDFTVRFSAGRVVEVTAAQGETVLRTMVASDEGAARLGEVALVPHSSPISQSGRLFYNTLFDENAASHVALGAAYRFTMKGGRIDDRRGLRRRRRQPQHDPRRLHDRQRRSRRRRRAADGTSEALMRNGDWVEVESGIVSRVRDRPTSVPRSKAHEAPGSREARLQASCCPDLETRSQRPSRFRNGHSCCSPGCPDVRLSDTAAAS